MLDLDLARSPRLLVPAFVLALVVPSCGGGATDPSAIEPVAGPADRSAVRLPADAAPPTTRSVPDPRPDPAAPANDPAPVRPGEGPTPAAKNAATAVVDAYDRALTDLLADPIAATAPGHPALGAWHAVVLPGSFSVTMLDDMTRRAAASGTVVRPGPGGLVHRHHVLEASSDENSISFTWCGHSPGVEVDVVSGEVVDDDVAVSAGTGLIRRDGPGWRLESLDEFEREVHPPGTADPCPASPTMDSPS